MPEMAVKIIINDKAIKVYKGGANSIVQCSGELVESYGCSKNSYLRPNGSYSLLGAKK